MNHSHFRKHWILSLFLLLSITMLLTGCEERTENQMEVSETADINQTKSYLEEINFVSPTSEITELTDGLSAVRYDGDYGFDEFLSEGGASSDGVVVAYLAENVLSGLDLGDLLGGIFGCSTIAVQSPEGQFLFGRNFDWNTCDAMVVESHPENGYASLSNMTSTVLWV